MTTPYRENAAAYFQAGWWPLPLHERSKFPPPEGYTGKDGKPVTAEDVIAHYKDPASANIAIRLPANVVGIDVDAYEGKTGAATLARLEGENGALPATVMVTSRTDGVSGIRLYRLPAGVDQATFHTGWPGIEIVRYGHRYAVAPPSIHPDTGAPYRWLTTTGEPAEIPTPESLPELPAAWAAACVAKTPPKATSAPQKPANPATLTHPCRVAPKWLSEALAALTTGASRHDQACREVARAVRLEDLGHDMTSALDTFGATFTAAIAADRHGGKKTADHEWRSLVETARALVANDPNPEPRRCCDPANDLHDATDLLRAGRHADLDAPRLLAAEPSQPSEDGDTSTWAPIDLTPYWDGTHVRPEAGILHRADGPGLLYPGRVHSFYGESESGKSWLAQIATAAVLTRGERAVYIDFEADAGDIVDRLRLLGVTRAHLAGLTYLRPETARDPNDPYWQALLATPCTLVIVDGVTEALTMWGGATKENDDITTWTRRFPRAVARATGAAVITIDHVAKDKETRGRFAIGGQAKLASIDGAAYLVEPLEAIAPGKAGRLTIRVTKDRPGAIRAVAGMWRKDRTQEAAVLTLDSTGRQIAWTLEAPLSEAEVIDMEDYKQRVAIMERLILPTPKAMKKGDLAKGVGKRPATALLIIDALEAEGLVFKTINGNAHYYAATDAGIRRFGGGLTPFEMPEVGQ